jgi:hypothetical protein
MCIIEKAKEFALKSHRAVNQKYDHHDYEFHLRAVVDNANKWIHLIPEEDRDDVIAGCWVHDVIEDTGKSYNEVLKATNWMVAEYSYTLTTEKGRNRKERANTKYYTEIRKFEHASFIKLCDRIANVTYSKESGSSMFKKYKEEFIFMYGLLWDSRFEKMWDELYEILFN